MAREKKVAPDIDKDGIDTRPMLKPSMLVRTMSLLEDYTPIKPVTGKNINSFEDAMMKGGMFGLNHGQVWLILLFGVLFVIVTSI